MAETKEVSKYVMLMRFFGILYALGALLFFFFPNELFYLINVGPKVFRVTEAIPDSVERFWLVLACSMMTMLSAISFLSAQSPKTKGYPFVHFLSKVISTLGFFYMFVYSNRYFAYLVGVTTDLPIALIVLWAMTWTRGAKVE
jgi:hypothetical protein